ncbi:MAG: hypothetical protein RQ745_02590 [Longimicrobiales bacterium]|nr:hypothetical protein [Longimicrobiales bacterium]
MPIAPTLTPPEGTAQRATLSREVIEFLIEFSIGVHRYAMYPPGHPSLRPAVENLVRRLARLFTSRRSVDIGVAQEQLVIEGVATDARHPVLSDLARRLHGHQLGALSLREGVGAAELHELLALLAEESDREGDPIGLREAGSLPEWAHVEMHLLGYDELEMRDAGGKGGDRATTLWLGLAQAALADTGDPDALGDAGAIARSIGDHKREEAYDQVIVGYMLQLADELKKGEDESVEVRARVTRLLREMDDTTLQRLVEMGGDTAARRRFVLDANEVLSVDVVMKILESAAASSGQTVSTSMTRLLSKLSAHAEEGAGTLKARASSALRENVEQLLEGWELDDPNPDQYSRVLDAMAHASPVFRGAGPDHPEEDRRELPGPVRVLRMAFEVDAFGPTVEAAVSDMLKEDHAVELFTMLAEAPEGHALAARLRSWLTEPGRVRALLEDDTLDEEGLHHLLAEVGAEAGGILLDVLLRSESRSVRRRLFDQLVEMGDAIRPLVIDALRESTEWYAARNLLSLLSRLPSRGEGVDLQPWLTHDDARVRREAVPLALQTAMGTARERVLVTALADPDERIARTALIEMRAGIPETVLPTLINRIVKHHPDDDLRVLAIRLLRTTRSRLVRDTLLDIVSTGKTLLGKPKLAERSALMVAALETLSLIAADESGVREVLEQAGKSKDPVVRGAVSP